MRFRGLHVLGLALLVFLTLLLLSRQSLTATLITSIIVSVIIIVEIVLALVDDEFSATHGALTVVLALSLAYLVINLMGPATLTTFFLGGLFVLAYLVTIVLLLVHDWRKYRVFDRFIKDEPRKPSLPAEKLIEEPPRIRLHQDDDGEWVELQVRRTPRKKTARSAKRASRTRKKAAKRARKTTAAKKTAKKAARKARKKAAKKAAKRAKKTRKKAARKR